MHSRARTACYLAGNVKCRFGKTGEAIPPDGTKRGERSVVGPGMLDAGRAQAIGVALVVKWRRSRHHPDYSALLPRVTGPELVPAKRDKSSKNYKKNKKLPAVDRFFINEDGGIVTADAEYANPACRGPFNQAPGPPCAAVATPVGRARSAPSLPSKGRTRTARSRYRSIPTARAREAAEALRRRPAAVMRPSYAVHRSDGGGSSG